MKTTLKLAAILGLAASPLAAGFVSSVHTGAAHTRTEVALPGDQAVWDAAGNAMVQGENITGHADGSPKNDKK